ncbi:hypothetical protein CA850_29360 [Micromonospora echinospora]|nr:hypothetical protein CA850_29360 [Micromonospora echinospora]
MSSGTSVEMLDSPVTGRCVLVGVGCPVGVDVGAGGWVGVAVGVGVGCPVGVGVGVGVGCEAAQVWVSTKKSALPEMTAVALTSV